MKKLIYGFIFIMGFCLAMMLSIQVWGLEIEARVISSEPIMKTEVVHIPYENCYKKKQKIYGYTHPAGEGTKNGGQIGQTVAAFATPLSHTGGMVLTVGGAVLGHLIEREDNSHWIEVPVCEIAHEPKRVTTIEGYLVTYEYNGQYYQTRTNTKPGQQFKILIKHEPVE